MKISKLELRNWRGFYKQQEITFSVDNRKPVTTIIGDNQTGKSDILRAIHWVLFDETPEHTHKPQDLINNFAENEDKNASAKVSLEIITDDLKTYKITRILRTDLDKGGGPSEFSVSELDYASNTFKKKNTPNEKQWINENILMHHLRHIFLFQGEVLSKAFDAGDSKQLKKSIENLTGSNYVNEASKMIDDFIDQKEIEQARKQTTINRDENLRKKIDEWQDERKKILQKISELEKDKKNLENERVEIMLKLRGSKNAELAAITATVDSLNEQIRVSENELTEIQENKFKMIGEYGFGLFTLESLKQFVARDDESKNQPEFLETVATPLREKALQKLLDKEMCICGRDLIDGEKPFKKIEEEIAKTGSGTMATALRNIDSLANSENIKAEFFKKRFPEIKKQYSDTEKRIEEFKFKLAESKDKMNALSYSNFDERELNDRLTKINEQEFPPIEQRLDEERLELLNINQELARAKAKTPKGPSDIDEIDKIIESAKIFRKELDEFSEDYEEKIASDLKEELQNLVGKYGTKGELIEFDQDSYIPHLCSAATGERNPQSEGGANMKSIFFGSSLVKLAVSRKDDDPEWLEPGTTFPFVCDAPFSVLDGTNEGNAAEVVIGSGTQVILLVNTKAFMSDTGIYKKLQKLKKEGKRWFLSHHIPGKQGSEVDSDGVVIGKDVYKPFVEDSDFEGSKAWEAKEI